MPAETKKSASKIQD